MPTPKKKATVGSELIRGLTQLRDELRKEQRSIPDSFVPDPYAEGFYSALGLSIRRINNRIRRSRK